jgi:hypothetical protein
MGATTTIPQTTIAVRTVAAGRPKSFSDRSWRYFSRHRRHEYLAMLPALPPTKKQAADIDGLIQLEWNGLKSAKEARALDGREAREARREARQDIAVFERLLSAFLRSLSKPPPPRRYRRRLTEITADLDRDQP